MCSIIARGPIPQVCSDWSLLEYSITDKSYIKFYISCHEKAESHLWQKTQDPKSSSCQVPTYKGQQSPGHFLGSKIC